MKAKIHDLELKVQKVEEEDEDLRDVPEAGKQADPLRHAKINREMDGVTLQGKVENMEVGKISR